MNSRHRSSPYRQNEHARKEEIPTPTPKAKIQNLLRRAQSGSPDGRKVLVSCQWILLEICPLGCQGKLFMRRGQTKGSQTVQTMSRGSCSPRVLLLSMYCRGLVLGACECWRSHVTAGAGGWRSC